MKNTPQTTSECFKRSTMCQYDILKALFEKLSGRGPLGVSKLKFLRFGTISGLNYRIFWWFLSSEYSLLFGNETLFTPY
jgi:hypothetical protein